MEKAIFQLTVIPISSIKAEVNKTNILLSSVAVARVGTTFPDSPSDGDFVEIKNDVQTFLAFDYYAGAGGANIKGKTNIVFGNTFKWIYDSVSNTWY